AYEEFILDPTNARLTQWCYRIVTIKERSLQKTEETAKKCHELLMQGVALDKLSEIIKERKLLGKKGYVNVSKPLKHNDKELSKTYYESLSGLEEGMYSHPFLNKSRSNKTTVYRILYIDQKIPG